MNREVRDTIRTGKDPFAVGRLIAGVTTNTPDVGGVQINMIPHDGGTEEKQMWRPPSGGAGAIIT